MSKFQKGIALLITSRIESPEYYEIEAIFESIDKNYDSKLDKSEFEDCKNCFANCF